MFRLWVILVVTCFMGVSAVDDSDTDEHWEAFKVKFNKTYSSEEEERQRRDQFEKNLLHVALHNVKDQHDYDKGLHKYSDMSTKEQIAVLFKTQDPIIASTSHGQDFSSSKTDLPPSVDWVSRRKVTDVREQGHCRSCWAFAAAEAIESQIAITWNRLRTLSEQQLVDCSTENYGCDRGNIGKAFDYIMNAGGLVEDSDYPYTEAVGQCQDKDLSGLHYQLSDYKYVKPLGDEVAVARALNEKGPLATCIYASQDFKDYKVGIFKDDTYVDQRTTHCVLIVGYGTENGTDYWKLKNSWRSDWGEKGYIRIVRNQGNHLHIADYAYYPILK